MRKDRIETNCRNVRSKDGSFSPHIGKTTAERLARYCRLKNINKTKFVEQCINERLDGLEREYYETLSKDELIGLIMNK